MNDKWTTVSKVVVKVSLGLCALGVVFMFINGLVTGNGGVWITALISIIPVLISHIAWAMYIEMSENIIHIASRNTRETDRTLSDISQTLGKILANMSNGGAVRPDTPWKCSCGKVNAPDANFCQNCGVPEQTIFPISVYPVSGKKTGLLLQSLKKINPRPCSGRGFVIL